MHRHALEHFEQKEAGKGQRDKQQRVFDRALALQILIHRIDQADAEAALIEFGAIGLLRTSAQRFLQIGGKERRLPARAESVGSHAALRRQIIADKAGMRPVRGELDLTVAPDRGDLQMPRAQQLQLEGKLQPQRLGACAHRQRHMHAIA
jgi:hypothetical protein